MFFITDDFQVLTEKSGLTGRSLIAIIIMTRQDAQSVEFLSEMGVPRLSASVPAAPIQYLEDVLRKCQQYPQKLNEQP